MRQVTFGVLLLGVIGCGYAEQLAGFQDSLLESQIGVENIGRDKIQTEGWAAYIVIITLGLAVLSPFAIFFYMVSHRFAALRKLIDWTKGRNGSNT